MYLELVIHCDRVIRSASNLHKILLSRYEIPSQFKTGDRLKEDQHCLGFSDVNPDSKIRWGPEIFGRADPDPVSSYPVRFRHGITGATTFLKNIRYINEYRNVIGSKEKKIII